MIARDFAALLSHESETPATEAIDRLITHLENGATLLFVRRAVWISPDWFTAERLETHLALVLIEQAETDIWALLPEVFAVALYFPHNADTTLNALTMNTTARMLSERLMQTWEQSHVSADIGNAAASDDWDEAQTAFIGEAFVVLPIAPLLAGREIEANIAELNGFLEIIVNRQLTAQFQPIVNLKDGQVFGYEALIRGPKGGVLRRPGMMFHAADKARMVAWYDIACIEQIFAQAAQMGFGKTVAKRRLLFVNMDAEGLSYLAIQDRTLGEVAAQFGLSPAGIVLEVTERQAVEEFPRLARYLMVLREEGFRIAIDDAGAGYSSLQAIAELRPDFVKISRDLVKELDCNGVRRALLSALVEYARRVGTVVLAEGAETRDELAHLIDLGIPLGQGYLMGKPADDFRGVPRDTREFIQERVRLQERAQTGRSVSLGSIASCRLALPLHTPLLTIAQKFARNCECTSIVLEEDGYVRGLIMREQVTFALNTAGKVEPYLCPPDALASGWMQSRFLMADEKMPLEAAALLVSARNDIPLGNDLVVTRDGNRYVGTVSVRNLLSAVTELQKARLRSTDSLTGLPGRVALEQVLRERLSGNQPIVLIRTDILRFETFNRCYGTATGDTVLRTWAQRLHRISQEQGSPDDFLAHCGGDDFFLLTSADKFTALSTAIHSAFSTLCAEVYLPEHRERQIMEVEENGTIKQYPLLRLTLSAVTNRARKYTDAHSLLEQGEIVLRAARRQNRTTLCE